VSIRGVGGVEHSADLFLSIGVSPLPNGDIEPSVYFNPGIFS